MPAKKWVIVATFANPQSRDFKRWAAGDLPLLLEKCEHGGKNESRTTNNTANSLGQQLSHAAQLDGHFALCQTEYEAMARAVGIETGWHVLDVGCGTGSFLPLLADLVGASGEVTAIDIAPENVQISAQFIGSFDLANTVSVQEGNITELPFDDETFDTVWCANVTQYLTNGQFSSTLKEMIRVVKPGGIIAVKEFDLTSWQYQPSDPHLLYRLFNAQKVRDRVEVNGCLRPLMFRSLFYEAELENIWLKNFVSETQPPLRPNDKEYMQNLLQWLAGVAADADISESDKVIWRRIGDIDDDEHILNRPDFYARECHILAVGSKRQ